MSIPADWNVYKLGELATFHDELRKSVKAEERANRQGHYSYYGASGKIDTIDDYMIDGDFVLLSADGANILSRNSPVAFHAKGKFWVNDHAHILRAKNKTSNEYLVYALESIRYEKYSNGSIMPSLSREVCEHIKLCMPPLKEQRKIVEILSDCDAALEQKKKLINKEKQVYFGEFSMSHGNLCDGYESKEQTIDKIVRCHSIHGHQLQRSDYLESGIVPIIDQSESLICGYTNELQLTLSFPKGVVIFGDHTRNVKFFEGNFVAGADGIKLLVPVNEAMPVEYLHYLVSTAATAMPNLGYSRHYRELRNQTVRVVIGKHQQEEIARALKTLWSFEKQQAEILNLLNQQKNGLLRQLLAGEICVKGVA